MDRLAVQFRGLIERDLIDATEHMVAVFRETRQVPAPTGLVDALGETYQRLAMAAVQTFGARVYDQGKALGYQLERKEDFAARMARMALRYISQEAIRARITSVADTTRSLIVAAVTRGYEAGDTLTQIANDILLRVAGLSKIRADMIARTEVHGAANFGANEAAIATGLPLKKEWNASGDDNTRDTHTEADGQVVGMDEKFQVGDDVLAYPGDPSGSPEEVINCRCAISHIVQED